MVTGFFLPHRKQLTKNYQKSKILIIFCNVLKINVVFSNSRFLPRFLPRMNKYISYIVNACFCRVYGAKKRIFAGCKIVTFAKGAGVGGAPHATTDQRPTVILRVFFFRKPIQYLSEFSHLKSCSVPFFLGFFSLQPIQ
jgi:hypothetical protein